MKVKRNLLVIILALVLAVITTIVSAPDTVKTIVVFADNVSRHIPETSEAEKEIGLYKTKELRESDFDETEIIAEDCSQRTESSKTFVRADGALITQIYGTPVHYLKDDKYVEINNTINDQLKNTSNSFNVSFSQGDRQALASVSDENHAVFMTPVFENQEQNLSSIHVFNGLNESVNINKSNSVNSNNKLSRFDKSPLYENDLSSGLDSLNIKDIDFNNKIQETFSNNKSSVYYENVYNGIDIQYIVEGNSLKENIIVLAPQNEYVFKFELSFQNLVANLTSSGDVILANSFNEIVYTIPKGYMFDSAGMYSDDIDYLLETDEAGTTFLSVIACNEFFQSAVFPVVIDPTIKSVNTSGFATGSYHDTGKSSPSSNFRTGRDLFSPMWFAYFNMPNTESVNNILRDFDLIYADLKVTHSKNISPLVQLRNSTTPSKMHNSMFLENLNRKEFSSTQHQIDMMPYFKFGYTSASVVIRYDTYPLAQWTTYKNPILTMIYRDIVYTTTQDLGSGGTGILNLRSGKLNYIYESVVVNDGYLPINISHHYDEEFGTSFSVGQGFKLNLQQRYEDGAYVSADGRKYYFIDNYNRELGMELYMSGVLNLIDEQGNTLVFDGTGKLIEIHQFPSTVDKKLDALYIKIGYESTNSNRIKTVTNNKTKLRFDYDAYNRLSAIREMEGDIISGTIKATLATYGYQSSTIHRLTEARRLDSTTNKTGFTYFSNSRIESVKNPVGESVTYRYDGSGRVDRIISSNTNDTGTVNISYASSNSTAYEEHMKDIVRSTTKLTTGNFVRSVSFGGREVISDYAYEIVGNNIKPLVANFDGYDYLSFADTFANTRDVYSADFNPDQTYSASSAAVVASFVVPQSMHTGSHSFAISVWIRRTSGSLLFVGASGCGGSQSVSLNNQITDWQLVTLILEVSWPIDHGPNPTISIDVMASGFRLSSISVVHLPPRLWEYQQKNEFIPSVTEHGQIAQTFQFNSADERIYMTEYFYRQSTPALGYPRLINQIRVRSGAVTNRKNQFLNQTLTQESRVVIEYDDMNSNLKLRNCIKEIKTFGVDGSHQHSEHFTYYASGQLASYTDKNGVTTSYSDALLGLVKSTVVGGSGSPNVETTNQYQQGTGALTSTKTGSAPTTFGYTSKGELNRITHNGFDTNFEHYPDGRVYVTVPGRTLARYESINANKERVAYGNNQDIIYDYSASTGRLTYINHSDYTCSTFTYGDNTQSVSNPSGTSYSWADNLSMDVYTMSNNAQTFKAEYMPYDGTGSKFVESYFLNNALMDYYRHTYNSIGQIENTYRNANMRTDYNYDSLKRYTGKTLTYGSRMFSNTYTYANTASRICGEQFKVNNSTQSDLTYSYYQNGNLKTIHRNNGTQLIAWYDYDQYGRLLVETDVVGNKDVWYTYDDGGNLTTRKVKKCGTNQQIAYDTFTYDDDYKDLLKSYNGQSITYDGAGNPITSKWQGEEYVWKNGRQLAGMKYTSNNSMFIDYKYDHNGIRTSKTVHGVTTYYYVEGSRIWMEMTNGIMKWYFYDAQGIQGMYVAGLGEFYFEKNIFGDVVGIWNTSGVKVGEYAYDAWGNTVYKTNNAVTDANPFRYRGYYWDWETHFYYLNSRYYDPEICRFINADEPSMLFYTSGTAGGANLYAYCLNNPVMYSDSTGMIATATMATIFIGGLIISAALQLFGPSGSTQVAGGAASTANGGMATYTGFWLTRMGQWYLGIPLMVIGGLTMMWGGAEVYNGATGSQFTYGIDPYWYYGLGIGLNLASGIGTAANYGKVSAYRQGQAFLGKGNTYKGNGRWVSADGMRQLRIDTSHHILYGKPSGNHFNLDTARYPIAPGVRNVMTTQHLMYRWWWTWYV